MKGSNFSPQAACLMSKMYDMCEHLGGLTGVGVGAGHSADLVGGLFC